MYNKDSRLLCECVLYNGHYVLETSRDIFNVLENKRKRSETNDTELWLMRLGHIGIRRLSKLVKDGLIQDLTIEPYPICESCI